jgi:hypothetical protein
MRRTMTLALALALPAGAAGAQALLDRSFHLGPQYVSYKLTGPIQENVTELAIPFAVVIPIAERFTIDLGSAYASSRVKASGVNSEITGLTDTQIRANYTLGNDAVILTAGVNIPTGQSEVTAAQRTAAGRIGNDFFAFPISNFGSGFGGTGGIAAAKVMGDWNVGIGASMRYSASYTPFASSASQTAFKFEPGNEYRARLGADRGLWNGRMALGVSYSKFGNDQAGGFSYSTGDRIIGQGAYSHPLGSMNLFISGWDLVRMKGELAAGITAPWENIANGTVSLSFNAGGMQLEPSAELRGWSRDGGRAGRLASFGLRAHIDVGSFTILPSASLATGGYLDVSGATANISGYRGGMIIRYSR